MPRTISISIDVLDAAILDLTLTNAHLAWVYNLNVIKTTSIYFACLVFVRIPKSAAHTFLEQTKKPNDFARNMTSCARTVLRSESSDKPTRSNNSTDDFMYKALCVMLGIICYIQPAAEVEEWFEMYRLSDGWYSPRSYYKRNLRVAELLIERYRGDAFVHCMDVFYRW